MGRTLKIQSPEIYAPCFKPSRNKGLYGGRGSAKSHTFADLMLLRGLNKKPMWAVCVREIQRSLDQSVKKLLEDKIALYGLQSEFQITRNYIGTPGGGRIAFEGMQDYNADNIKSLEGYDVAWVEEAQTFSQRSLDLLRPTIRKEGSVLWFSWNPRYKTDPVDKFFRGSDVPPDSIVIYSTYKDNPWFPEVLRSEMEYDRRRDPDKYAYVWLGQYESHSTARVFKNWREEYFDTPRYPVPRFLFGADWGFSVDPTVLIRSFVEGRKLLVDWEAYQVGCEIEDTPDLFDTLGCTAAQHFSPRAVPAPPPCKAEGHAMARPWPILGDSARPETISHIRRHGYPKLEAAKKGAGSVEEGVKFLQNFDIVVHPRCKHTIDELTLYSWKTDKLTGEILPELADKDNHVIDALRYSAEKARTARAKAGLAF